MATQQTQVVVYLPPDEAVEFKQLVADQDKTIAAVLRRLIREYIAEAKAAA
jgi:hypothetical protein